MKANYFESALSEKPIGKRKCMKKRTTRKKKRAFARILPRTFCLREIFLTTTLRDEMDLTDCLTYGFDVLMYCIVSIVSKVFSLITSSGKLHLKLIVSY